MLSISTMPCPNPNPCPPLPPLPAANLARAEVLGRSLLLMQFVSLGVPLLSASTLALQGVARYIGTLAALRLKYRDLLTPPLFDSPRDIRWQGAQGACVGCCSTLKPYIPSPYHGGL